MTSQKPRRPVITALRILLPCLILLWVFFIFSSSGKTGDESGAISHQWAAILSGDEALEDGTELESGLRKLGHLAEYALLGLLLACCLRSWTHRLLAFSAWPLLFGLGVAVLDECYQLFVPGRAGLVQDVLLDLMGIGAGMVLGYVIFWIVSLTQRTRAHTGQTTG